MKKLILFALLGMLLLNGCEKNIQASGDLLVDKESTQESIDIEKVYAFNLDDLNGETICNPVTAEMLKEHSNTDHSALIIGSKAASGNFISKSGILFAFSVTSNPGGVSGVGTLNRNGDNVIHLRYNITSLAVSGKKMIFQGVITKSVNFNEKYAVGNSIIFNLEEKSKEKESIDRYNAAVYSFSPHMDNTFYYSQAWLDCGSECFPEDYYLEVENGSFEIE